MALHPVHRIFSIPLRLLPDRVFIQLRFLHRFKRLARLSHPRTYNEKLQWLKLNYRDPLEAKLVDKAFVKEWVAERIGDEHIIPTLGVWESFDEIDFDALPESFVLKCTHDSGGVVLVRSKSDFDRESARAKLERSLKKSYFWAGREPHYKTVVPRIIAEPYLEDPRAGQLIDYKFFCFNGEVKALFIATDRATGKVKFDYFTRDFEWIDVRQPYPNAAVHPAKPATYDQMIAISEKLAEGMPHVRVDLYEVEGHVYFGELTFHHFSGFQPFKPPMWDEVFGDWLELPLREAR